MDTPVQVTVMIVDDSRVSRMIMRELFGQMRPNWRVIEAADGAQAIALAASDKPQFATLDINMPGMDGFQLARELQRQHPAIGLCMFSANIQHASHEEAAELGVAFVPKPVDERSVAQAIASFEGNVA
jgi:CheY-like chemotaxis protein